MYRYSNKNIYHVLRSWNYYNLNQKEHTRWITNSCWQLSSQYLSSFSSLLKRMSIHFMYVIKFSFDCGWRRLAKCIKHSWVISLSLVVECHKTKCEYRQLRLIVIILNCYGQKHAIWLGIVNILKPVCYAESLELYGSLYLFPNCKRLLNLSVDKT